MAKLETIILRDTRANQPAAGTAGRLYYVTDESVLERDSGSAWQSIEGSGTTPAAHAASHASGGGDPVTLAQSQVTNLTSDLAAKAPLASPTFTGTPAAPTATGGTNTTQVATTAFVTGEIGTHAADTTSVHGITDTSTLYRAGGTDVALADGGTGASLSDPNADRILFWDDSAGALTWLTPGTGLTITTTTIDAAGGGALTVEEVDGSPTDSAVTKIVFPNGTLGIASHVATYTPSGGGGGATVNTGADASKGTGTSGDLYLPNDGFYAYRSNGSAQIPWGPIFPLVAPINANFAWINQGSAVVSTTNGGVVLSIVAGAATHLRIRKEAAPGSTPYTVTAAFLASMIGGDAQCGIVFRDSSNGKCITHAYESNEASTLLSQHWTDATSVSSNVLQLFASFGGPLIWLRLVDDGTNHLRQISADGQNWQQFLSVSRTTWTSAIDEVGFYISTYSSSYPVAMSLLHWSVT